jgi:hypothetical protein
MGTVSLKSEAASRSVRMLRTAMGPAITGWLEDPPIVEIMLNPDGRFLPWAALVGEGIVLNKDGRLAENPNKMGTSSLARRDVDTTRRDHPQGPREPPLCAQVRRLHSPQCAKKKRPASRRWVPWLLAYTGARAGEMCQLRVGDVHVARTAVSIDPTPGRSKLEKRESSHPRPSD